MVVAVIAAVCFGSCARIAWAQTPQADPTATSTPATAEPQRPRVGLVLSGGGARGFAHVGVLRALRELNVPVDLVAGVSMGSVVGGAYAAGVPIDEMLSFVRTTAWGDIVSDRPPRDDLAFRRREDDLILPSRVEFGIARAGISLPPSAAGNAALEAALVRLLPTGTGDLPVDRLALPFRSVASDLLTGELVELKDTPLFMSIRASLAVPGVFAPVHLSGRLVVDGGLVRNLPVDIARAMGADVVIAVNVGTPLAGESELTSALGVARQMMNILTEQNVQRSLREIGARDILIAPDLSGIGFLDFKLGEAAIAAGEEAVRRVAERLRPLAVSPQTYAAFEQARTQPAAARDQALRLARVDVRPTEHAGSDALAALIGLREGDPATVGQVHGAASRLLGRGEFERVDVDVRDAAGRREVTVTPKEAAWARNRVRVGLEVSSDTKDDHRFVVSGLHTLSWVNTWGAEWRNLLRIGSERLLLTQLWQPLAPGSNWFIAPALGWNASSFDAFEQGRRAFRASYEFGSAALTFGRQFAQWGNVEFSVARRSGRAEVSIPASIDLTNGRIDERVLQGRIQIDTLDSLALPSRGWLLDARTERARTATGEMRRAASAVGLSAFRVGDWAGHVYAEWAESDGGVAPLSLGGFLRLSGTPRDSRSGRTVVLGRLVMARRIGDMPAGLGGAVRLGYSLELGEGFAADTAVRLGDARRAGSGFVSVDTRFGPVFFGAGATRHGGSALYLFLGPFW